MRLAIYRKVKNSFGLPLIIRLDEFKASLDEKFKAMKSDFDLELGRHQNQINPLSRSIDTLIERIQKVKI